MSDKFLLPCTCGEKLVVGRAQAGLTIACTCGREWEVPTRRGLEQLEPAEPAVEPAPKRTWGPAQALMALGILITLVSGGWAAYRYFVPPEVNPDISINRNANRAIFERMTITQTFEYWDLTRHDIESDTDPLTETAGQMADYYRLNYRDYWRWTWFFAGLAAAGLVLAISGLLLFAPGTRKRAPQRHR